MGQALREAPTLDRLLSSGQFFADPYPVYRRLRAESPVHWYAPNRQWLVARFDDADTVLRSPRQFSSCGFQRTYFDRLRPELRAAAPTLDARASVPSLISSDPPAHTRLRRHLQAWFTPRAVEALRAKVVEIVDELLASRARSNEIDVVAELAGPLPATMIAEIMGIPRAERDVFTEMSADIVLFTNRTDPNTELSAAFAEKADRSLATCHGYLEELIQVRRREPRDDVVSALVQSTPDGDTLELEEILANLVLFLNAGHETTAILIANAMLLFVTHPEQLALLRADPALMPQAIEEVLRFESPVQRLRRVVAEEVELAGMRLSPGEPLEVLIGSANRDEAKFADPDAFRIQREPSRHLALGKAAHFCIGASLARLEANVALTIVLARFAEIRLADGWELEWPTTTNNRGPKSLRLSVESA